MPDPEFERRGAAFKALYDQLADLKKALDSIATDALRVKTV